MIEDSGFLVRMFSCPQLSDPRSRQLFAAAGIAIAIWCITVGWLWASLRSH